MSIKVMSRVWAHSRQSASALLLMLALADGSDDDGICFADINDLAHKARLTVEQTNDELNRLIDRGVLKKLENGNNCFQIIEAHRVN